MDRVFVFTLAALTWAMFLVSSWRAAHAWNWCKRKFAAEFGVYGGVLSRRRPFAPHFRRYLRWNKGAGFAILFWLILLSNVCFWSVYAILHAVDATLVRPILMPHELTPLSTVVVSFWVSVNGFLLLNARTYFGWELIQLAAKISNGQLATLQVQRWLMRGVYVAGTLIAVEVAVYPFLQLDYWPELVYASIALWNNVSIVSYVLALVTLRTQLLAANVEHRYTAHQRETVWRKLRLFVVPAVVLSLGANVLISSFFWSERVHRDPDYAVQFLIWILCFTVVRYSFLFLVEQPISRQSRFESPRSSDDAPAIVPLSGTV